MPYSNGVVDATSTANLPQSPASSSSSALHATITSMLMAAAAGQNRLICTYEVVCKFIF
jgi:hypothetical protein